ncbi:GatB/YqeY domain-containing protein [Patescibacteria group bacterium]|nr:GatB/YqeY domain-containing protein [Patescibacteria group bacterium]
MLLASLTRDIQESLKKGNQVRVGTLRFLLSQVRNDAIARYGAQAEEKLTDRDILDVIRKQVKTHRESIEAFRAAGRAELVEKEEAELAILQAFLPKELTDEELHTILLPFVLSDEANFGLLMKAAMALVAGRADGKRVSEILKQLLSRKQ